MFWHQHLRRTFTSLAAFLTHSVLRLRKHSLPARYVHLSLVFFLSGLLHTLTEVTAHNGGSGQATISLSESQCMRFFLTQAVGIMVEDGVQEMVKGVRLLVKKPSEEKSTVYDRMIRRVWLILFWGWSTPAIIYPAARLSTGKGADTLLPFSIVKTIRQ